MHNIIEVSTEEQYYAAKILFKQYAKWLGIDLSFQHFEEELAALKKIYGTPSGIIFLYKQGEEFVACVAIRKIDKLTCELKRMYVQSHSQRQGIGQILLNKAMTAAIEMNYKKVRLDTLSNMLPAISLYKKNGFIEIPAYYHNPQPGAIYFEKLL